MSPHLAAGAKHFAPARRLRVALAGAALCVALSASAVDDGQPAPAFDLPVLGGGAHGSLDAQKGKVVFVDFWASWCGPCRQSLPLYDKLNAELTQQPFTLLAVNLDEDDADAKGFLKEHPVHYSVLRDPAGDVPKAFGLVGMPTSYLIDQHGIVRAHHSGFDPKDLDTLRREIHALLETHANAK